MPRRHLGPVSVARMIRSTAVVWRAGHCWAMGVAQLGMIANQSRNALISASVMGRPVVRLSVFCVPTVRRNLCASVAAGALPAVLLPAVPLLAGTLLVRTSCTIRFAQHKVAFR